MNAYTLHITASLKNNTIFFFSPFIIIAESNSNYLDPTFSASFQRYSLYNIIDLIIS